jgi:hypothetical protein
MGKKRNPLAAVGEEMARQKSALDALFDSATQPFRDLQDALIAIAEQQRALHGAIEDICGCEEPSVATAPPPILPPPAAPPASPKQKRYKPPIAPPLYPPGDERWLEGKPKVSRAHACRYLGIKYTTLQKLLSDGVLDRDGKHFVTTESLRAYWNGKRKSRKIEKNR